MCLECVSAVFPVSLAHRRFLFLSFVFFAVSVGSGGSWANPANRLGYEMEARKEEFKEDKRSARPRLAKVLGSGVYLLKGYLLYVLCF